MNKDDNLSPELRAAVPDPKVTDADAIRDTEKVDRSYADAGTLDQEGPAIDSSGKAGRTPDEDPNPGNPTGTQGIESSEADIAKDRREIPGAYSGNAPRYNDPDENESKA
ncbi:MAG TPA: hypothetical protein VNT60_07475 [Deinococcales bacterium]|nr:hypothetical protein [Deinococcales bacterium]